MSACRNELLIKYFNKFLIHFTVYSIGFYIERDLEAHLE